MPRASTCATRLPTASSTTVVRLFKQIKADESLRTIPVLMISGVGEADSMVRCIEQGAVTLPKGPHGDHRP
jgi:hypothetical protein